MRFVYAYCEWARVPTLGDGFGLWFASPPRILAPALREEEAATQRARGAYSDAREPRQWITHCLVSVGFKGRTFADSFRISCARPRRCQIYHCGPRCRDRLDLAPWHRPALPGVVRCDVAAGAGMCAPSVLSGAAPPPHRRHTTVTSPTHASATHARPAVP